MHLDDHALIPRGVGTVACIHQLGQALPSKRNVPVGPNGRARGGLKWSPLVSIENYELTISPPYKLPLSWSRRRLLHSGYFAVPPDWPIPIQLLGCTYGSNEMMD